jgi:hypothetical protein
MSDQDNPSVSKDKWNAYRLQAHGSDRPSAGTQRRISPDD